jgi:hypothetical protein
VSHVARQLDILLKKQLINLNRDYLKAVIGRHAGELRGSTPLTEVGLYKLNPGEPTHSLKAPGFSSLEPIK